MGIGGIESDFSLCRRLPKGWRLSWRFPGALTMVP